MFLSTKLLYSDNFWTCSQREANMYYIVYSRHNQLEQINIRIIIWNISWLQGAGHIKNIYYTVVLIFQHIQFLHLLNSEVTWVVVSSGTQVQAEKILHPDYLPEYLPVSYYYDLVKFTSDSSKTLKVTKKFVAWKIEWENIKFFKNCDFLWKENYLKLMTYRAYQNL